MLLRALTLAAGLTGAAGASQFPEFSQQYVQRLGGAVDELSRFVAGFDADAGKLGLTREAALADLAKGGAMGEARAETMGRAIARYERLSGDLETLAAAGPFTRAYYAGRMGDGEIAARAWAAFKPAVPLGFAGATFAAGGFVAGLAVAAVLFGLLRRLLPRRRAKTVAVTPGA